MLKAMMSSLGTRQSMLLSSIRGVCYASAPAYLRCQCMSMDHACCLPAYDNIKIPFCLYDNSFTFTIVLFAHLLLQHDICPLQMCWHLPALQPIPGLKIASPWTKQYTQMTRQAPPARPLSNLQSIASTLTAWFQQVCSTE